MSELNIVEASIAELKNALKSGSITSVELVACYLHRISAYDCRGITLNSVPLLNSTVFEEAAASDDRHAAGLPARPLEGIPYTVKNSYKVKGLTVAAGSPAFHNLRSNEDSFIVEKLREAGAVLIGQTNTPPMMYGGMQRGVYGRAESPYNLEYLTAAFASGSSNGSGTSTAASFAAFGMGSETVSSGRSPASNNALIAYTPSRGLISPRGIWPLYPTCDVVVPHTRTMKDLFDVLSVITAKDANTEGDLWRQQSHIQLPDSSAVYPRKFRDLAVPSALTGKRIAVPEMYVGGHADGQPIATRKSVIDLWNIARANLEALEATVVITPDLPLVANYERETFPGQRVNIPGAPPEWNSIERGAMISHAWNDFLVANGDTNIPSLTAVDTTQIWPTWDPKSVQVRYSEPSNAIRWADLSKYIKMHPNELMLELPGLEQALNALEVARKRDLEDWLDARNCDFVVFPANGDVGKADSDVNDESSKQAWTNGVKYSNGNRAIRHLGVPTVSVPMGIMEDETNMPVNLTFAGKAYDDTNLLSYAYSYEQGSKKRRAPGLTPPLETDKITLGPSSISAASAPISQISGRRPRIVVSHCRAEPASDQILVQIQGHASFSKETSGLQYVHIYVNGVLAEHSHGMSEWDEDDDNWCYTFLCTVRTAAIVARAERNRTEATVARDQTMIVILAMMKNGRASGWLKML